MHEGDARDLSSLLLFELLRLLAVPLNRVETNTAVALQAHAVVVVAIEEPQIHHHLVTVLRGVHGDHEGARPFQVIGGHFGVTVGVGHIHRDNLPSGQIGLRIVIAERVSVGHLLLANHSGPSVPHVLVPPLGLVPAVS